MRSVIFLLAALTTTTVYGQPSNPRSEIVYFIGQVTASTGRQCAVDLGEVHTVSPLTELAVFRFRDGYFAVRGRITAGQTEATTCVCRGVSTQVGDLVAIAREMNELRSGSDHRKNVLKREVLRERALRFRSTFGNVNLADSLSTYEQRYPKWERIRSGRVAGRLLSTSLKDVSTSDIDRLQQQLDLMRGFYTADAFAVTAAGETWEDVFPVLAGSTASAGHALLLDTAAEQNEVAVQIAPSELRGHVEKRIFHLNAEQRNVVSMLLHVMLARSESNVRAFLDFNLPLTQFPALEGNEQLVDDIEGLMGDLSASGA